MPRAQQSGRKLTRTDRELVALAKDIAMEKQTLRITRNVFDLDSRDYVEVIKTVEFTPVENTADALAIVGNDAKKFLEIVNAGLRDYQRDQAANDDSVAWQTESEDGTLQPFSGTTLTEEKSKQLAANVLNMAKMLFGYNKDMSREDKRSAKDKATEMLLGNPAVIEALKK